MGLFVFGYISFRLEALEANQFFNDGLSVENIV